MLGAEPVKTPMEQNLRLSKFEGKMIADPTVQEVNWKINVSHHD